MTLIGSRQLLLIGVLGGGLLLGGCGYQAPAATVPSTGQPQVNQPTTGPAAAVATANAVTIQNFAFSPATLTVPAGTTVTWTNSDSATHTVTGDTFKSGNLSPGQTFSFTFPTAGTFNYSCSIHPMMKGTIIVQ